MLLLSRTTHGILLLFFWQIHATPFQDEVLQNRIGNFFSLETFFGSVPYPPPPPPMTTTYRLLLVIYILRYCKKIARVSGGCKIEFICPLPLPGGGGGVRLNVIFSSFHRFLFFNAFPHSVLDL